MSHQLSVGFSRMNITPMRGIGISGYFIPRYAEGVLDDLHVRATAVSVDEDTVLMIALDLLLVQTPIMNNYRQQISEATGVPVSAIYVHCQHTHTGPYVDPAYESKASGTTAPLTTQKILDYQKFLGQRLVDAAVTAMEDRKPARMGYGVGKASNIAFIRRFRMKDGSVRTNPGVNNPDIVAPIGELDERVSVVRFDREGGSSVVMVNYADHPDVVGGNLISADWPGFLCHTVEKALDNVDCIFFNGAQGDVNHVNVHPAPGFLNDMFMDFDDVSRGYGHARYMGRVVAGAVLQVFDKVAYVDEVDKIRFLEKTVEIPSNMPTPEELIEAKRINELHVAGRDAEIPFEGMMLTTVVAEAGRMIRLADGPVSFPVSFSAVAIGKVAFFGIPGEPFNGIGRAIKDTEGFDLIIPCCLVNGSEGYFPMKDAYDEGGYEARSSIFKAGVAELIIAQGKEMLTELAKQ